MFKQFKGDNITIVLKRPKSVTEFFVSTMYSISNLTVVFYYEVLYSLRLSIESNSKLVINSNNYIVYAIVYTDESSVSFHSNSSSNSTSNSNSSSTSSNLYRSDNLV